MVEIPTLDPSEAPRARRWDALILGSGLSALVAAARISAAGHRVLVVEEEARAKQAPALKEPFFLGGLRDQGLLDATLRALSVPLIDRRRIGNERLAYQVAADPYRVDVGQPLLTAEELVTWGLAKPEAAQVLVRRLVEASEIERTLLYESPFVRFGRRSAAARLAGAAVGDHKRGLPGEVAAAEGALGRFLAAQVRALSNLGSRPPAPEAQARLLGLGLAGGAGFADDPPWLVDLFRKRVTALYGDVRTLPGEFELIQVSGQPGIRVRRSGEIWLGRVLVLGAPRSSLRAAYAADAVPRPPDVLAPARSRAHRAVFLFRVETAILPEGMGARLILPGPLDAEAPAVPTATVTAFPSQTHPHKVDLVARVVLEEAGAEDLEARIEAARDEVARRLQDLMPFSEGRLDRVDFDRPRWDGDDGWLEDPSGDGGWPGEVDLRVSSKPRIHALDRAAVGGLGLEGDLLLGWRGGDAIAEELS